jgi:UDP-glucose 4-epimerase
VNGESTPPDRPLRESDPPHPLDDYGRSKWQAERALAAVAAETGLRAAALRLPLCYGPGAKANVAALARVARMGVPLPLASVDNRRSVLGTGNFASAVIAMLAHPDKLQAGALTPFFVADAGAVSTADFARGLARAQGRHPRLWPLPASVLRIAAAAVGRSDAVERLLGTLEVDTSAFRSTFGWTPPYSLEEGLAGAFARRPPL